MAIIFAAGVLIAAFTPLTSPQTAIILALAFLLLGLSAALIGQVIDRAIEAPSALFGKYLAPIVIAACLLSSQFIDDTLAIAPTIEGSSTLQLIALLGRSITRVCAVASVSIMILMSCVLVIELPARWLAELSGATHALPLSATRIIVICAVFYLAGSSLTQLLNFELNPGRLLALP